MPRIARLDTPGLLHHIMIRGIERRRIFRDDEDREDLLRRIARLLPETKTRCYAWAFMPNHAHFLMRSGPTGVSSLMGRLLTGYAGYFNRRFKRHGPLFQNRYRSIICQEDIYLTELVRYIHLNPLRANLVSGLKELESYPYSGHSAVMGKREREWQDIEYVLGIFGKKTDGAKKAYLSFVQEGLPLGRRPELVGGGLIRSLGGWEAVKLIRLTGQDRIKSDQRILGESDFVREVLAESEKSFSRKYKLRTAGYTYETIVERVSLLLKMEKEYITGKGKQKDRVKGKDLICYWSVIELGISKVELARKLELTPSAVGYAVLRGEKMAQNLDYHLITDLI